MSQPIEMAVRIDINVLESIEIAFRTDITVLQSKEMAVRRDKTVSQPIDIPSCEIKLCHSQWRCLNERYNGSQS